MQEDVGEFINKGSEKIRKILKRTHHHHHHHIQQQLRTKTKIPLKGQIVNEATRKSLLFHHVLLKEIKCKYAKAKKEKTRQVLIKAVSSDLLKKYRIKMFARKQLNLTQRRLKELQQKTQEAKHSLQNENRHREIPLS
jgi:hypothetical protein